MAELGLKRNVAPEHVQQRILYDSLQLSLSTVDALEVNTVPKKLTLDCRNLHFDYFL